jgi:hypothetical protein
MMVGVAMATSFATLVGSYVSSLVEWGIDSYPGDLQIASSAAVAGAGARHVTMSKVLGEKLEALPQVDRIRKVRFAEINYRDYPVKLVSSEVQLLRERARMKPPRVKNS